MAMLDQTDDVKKILAEIRRENHEVSNRLLSVSLNFELVDNPTDLSKADIDQMKEHLADIILKMQQVQYGLRLLNERLDPEHLESLLED